MAFCKACGADIGAANFCPKCGANQGAPAPAAAGGAPAAASPTEGLQENVAGLLCYLVGWISGLIFLLIDKRPFVRFHGAQSIAFNIAIVAVWVVFWIVTAILTFITAMMHFPIGFLTIFFAPVVGLAIFATWIFLMYKAYQGEKFKLPVIGNLVEGMIK
jgi:uncharacterized membrane protein